MAVTIPFVFVGGTRAVASQVNADFSAVADAINTGTRTILTADTTFYVAPSGSDSGPATSPSAPAATVNYIENLLITKYDFAGKNVLIQLADGSYNENVVFRSMMTGQQRPGNLVIQGNLATPTNVVFSGSPAFTFNNGSNAQIQGMRITSPSSAGLVVANFSEMLYQLIDFSTCSLSQVDCTRRGFAFAIGNYSISGGATCHVDAGDSTFHLQQATVIPAPPTPGIPTVTLNGTPNFSIAFIRAANLAYAKSLATFVGGATGKRYESNFGAVIDTSGAGPNYFPGNIAGTTNNGQYI